MNLTQCFVCDPTGIMTYVPVISAIAIAVIIFVALSIYYRIKYQKEHYI